MFDNDKTNWDSANKGKYYINRGGAAGVGDQGGKDVACDNVTQGDGDCFVDVWGNIAEGALKGTYTQATSVASGTVYPYTKAPVVFSALHDFTDEATFIKKVDNSMAGQMRDCGECHVGGGAMEYIPVAQGTNLGTTARPALRDIPAMLSAGSGVNTFSYFIDQYDEDGDGVLGEAIATSYADTGVMEMDCLMCHMDGYSWADRTEAVRKGNFDASRVAGAGLGTADNADGSLNLNGIGVGTGYGKIVTYDPLMVVDDGSQNATLSAAALATIEGTPPSANCSSCHFDMHQVDWKKRGSTWDENMAYETEVHGSVGCMGCHTRDDGVNMNPDETIGENDGIWTGSGSSTMLGHDPSKGNAPYSSLWNANDNNVRTCAFCHAAGDPSGLLAPDPTSRHDQLGLTATLVQSAGMGKMTGVANAGHLDIITCEACHTRKLGHGPASTHSMYEWGTGGALVDSTGPDTAGRLTDHENLFVERLMENNLSYAWQGNKIGPRNTLVTMFWRDKADKFNYGNVGTYPDINADGQDGAMDAVNPSHVRNVMTAAGLDVLTHDGVIDDAEIAAQRSALMSGLGTYGIDTTGAKLKLSLMGVMFKANHGVSPAANAWGAGGCKDCHGADKGFYNGAYDMKPLNLTASWTNSMGVNDDTAVGGKKPKWNYVVPFTKVNMDNYSGRDVTLPICSSYYGPNPRPALPAQGTLADIGNACSHPDTAAAGTWTVYPLGDIKADWQFTDFHPTQFAKGLKGRSIAITAAFGGANGIRTMDRSEGLWEAKFVTGTKNLAITGTDGTSYTTRAAWVAYLNGQGNYRPAIHYPHVDGQGMSCSDCHYAGISDVDTPVAAGYAVVRDDSKDFLTGTPLEYFVPTIGATGTATCATQCHDVLTAGGTTADNAIARISAQHSTTENFTVQLDASSSACFNVDLATGVITQGTKGYTFATASTAGTLTACAAPLDTDPACNSLECDTTVTGGPCDVTLDLTCSAGGGVTDSVTVAITGYDIGMGTNDDPGLTAGVLGNVATVTAATLDSEVATVTILWGDYTKIDTDAASLSSGVAHTYAASGTYTVTVTTTNDGDPNNAMYTYTLTVTIP
ncbi:MAG: hypothetical protein K9K37_11735 [Desulfocapsa sp.]|nr:hypothetical protein [Desulfocapsa sp.]